jgi:flagellin-like protein
MSRSRLRHDGRAVSPVVGAVLLIAVVAVLVAAVGTFVVGANDRVTEPVDAEVQFTLDGGTVTVEYTDVEPLRADRVDVVGDEASGSTLVTVDADAALGANADVAAGDEWVAATNVERGDVIRVVYDVPGDDRTVVVGAFEA